MKVVSSLKSLKKRDINCKVVRRRGKLYVINKKKPKFKKKFLNLGFFIVIQYTLEGIKNYYKETVLHEFREPYHTLLF